MRKITFVLEDHTVGNKLILGDILEKVFDSLGFQHFVTRNLDEALCAAYAAERKAAQIILDPNEPSTCFLIYAGLIQFVRVCMGSDRVTQCEYSITPLGKDLVEKGYSGKEIWGVQVP